MNSIVIYKAEASAGLADKIRACSSVAYACPVYTWDSKEQVVQRTLSAICEKSQAHFKDLYPTKSILASSNWNLNDDVFGKYQTWAARHTPANKPTNLEHDETKLVGHITDNWVIADGGTLIPDDTVVDDLPELFHICNGAVIYLHWEDSALVDRAAKLVAEVEAGEKFVSMECLFNNFSYALIGPNDEYCLVPRSEATAFLTKHLRAYGGTGKFEDYRVGRLLENITFSGKGYVNRPANPHSIIFNDSSLFNFSEAVQENPFDKSAGVHIPIGSLVASQNSNKDLTEKINMSEQILKEQNVELKANIADLNAKLAAAQKQAQEAAEAQYASKIGVLTQAIEAAKQKSEADKKAIDEAVAKVGELEGQLAEITTAKTQLEQKLAEEAAAKTKAERVSTLVDGGIEKTEAETKVNTFASLTSEQFTVLATELIEAAKSKKTPVVENKTEATETTEDEDGDGNADAEVLEGAEASAEAGEQIVSEEDADADNTRASLGTFVAAMIGKKVSVSEDAE